MASSPEKYIRSVWFSTRLTSLLAQVETSYALTARIQQLSLLKFMS